jgi:phage recombination protein Bet
MSTIVKKDAVAVVGKKSILAKVAARYSIEPDKLLETLKATAFKGQVSNEQMVSLLVVADQYGLNPFTKEVFAFPDKNNGIVPVVGVDGWSRIINTHDQFDGVEFQDAETLNADALPEWCECTIYRKDRQHPTKVKEYMDEVKRKTGPWDSHPRRMLRHKALIQCARLAFGFSGIYDQDEGERIAEVVNYREPIAEPKAKAIEVKAEVVEPVKPSLLDEVKALVDASKAVAIEKAYAAAGLKFEDDPALEMQTNETLEKIKTALTAKK